MLHLRYAQILKSLNRFIPLIEFKVTYKFIAIYNIRAIYTRLAPNYCYKVDDWTNLSSWLSRSPCRPEDHRPALRYTFSV